MTGDGALVWRTLLALEVDDLEVSLRFASQMRFWSRNDLLGVATVWQATHGYIGVLDRALADLRPVEFPLPKFQSALKNASLPSVMGYFRDLAHLAADWDREGQLRSWMNEERWDEGRDFGPGDVWAPLDPPPPSLSPGYRELIPA